MTPERWKQVNALFHATLEQPSGAQRAFLHEHTSTDPDLRPIVGSLLQAHASNEGFLETPAWAARRNLMFEDHE